jgi:hypothetical protein
MSSKTGEKFTSERFQWELESCRPISKRPLKESKCIRIDSPALTQCSARASASALSKRLAASQGKVYETNVAESLRGKGVVDSQSPSRCYTP